jgi:hypothetical protein
MLLSRGEWGCAQGAEEEAVAIQWRRLAQLALGRAAQTENAAEKVIFLDIAARYRELAERTEGSSAGRTVPRSKDRDET